MYRISQDDGLRDTESASLGDEKYHYHLNVQKVWQGIASWADKKRHCMRKYRAPLVLVR